ncbi:MAG TPA: DUF6114 domain-containing protein [Nocardioides sp.]|uniref:DUF6114 domain-containing protein n=1 Tax=Nocardioides sp. TaxID=35761 RepID=UPI002ED90702
MTDTFGIVTDPQPDPTPDESTAGSTQTRSTARPAALFAPAGRLARAGWRWFTAFRRTRPFWGGLWCILAGLELMWAMSFSIGLALTGGWSYAAGYVMGGGLVLFGVTTWLAPQYKALCGLVAFLIALGAFPTANLGGYLLGSVLGIIGSSMIWAWGEKKPKRTSGRARRRRRDVEE